MATTKAKTAKKPAAKKKPASKPKTTAAKTTKKATVATAKTAAKTTKKNTTTKTAPAMIVSSKTHPVKEFFSRKFDASENVLTIFKNTKILGAMIGEIFGTAVVTMVALTLGLFNPLYMVFAYLGVTMVVFRLSGANLNPAITVGMLASRRMSAIRGVLYLVSQVLGAWLGFTIVNAFFNVGINSGAIDATTSLLPALTPAADLVVGNSEYNMFWPIVMLEFFGAIVIAFFYARAIAYKKSPLTFAATVATGVFAALLIAVIICSNFLMVNDNIFVMNPAIAVVYGLFPSSAEGFDALMSALMPMLVTYVIFPMIGGVAGFYLSDIAGKLSGEELTA